MSRLAQGIPGPKSGRHSTGRYNVFFGTGQRWITHSRRCLKGRDIGFLEELWDLGLEVLSLAVLKKRNAHKERQYSLSFTERHRKTVSCLLLKGKTLGSDYPDWLIATGAKRPPPSGSHAIDKGVSYSFITCLAGKLIPTKAQSERMRIPSSRRFEKTRGTTLAIRNDKPLIYKLTDSDGPLIKTGPLTQIDGTSFLLVTLFDGHRDSIFHGNIIMRQ